MIFRVSVVVCWGKRERERDLIGKFRVVKCYDRILMIMPKYIIFIFSRIVIIELFIWTI